MITDFLLAIYENENLTGMEKQYLRAIVAEETTKEEYQARANRKGKAHLAITKTTKGALAAEIGGTAVYITASKKLNALRKEHAKKLDEYCKAMTDRDKDKYQHIRSEIANLEEKIKKQEKIMSAASKTTAAAGAVGLAGVAANRAIYKSAMKDFDAMDKLSTR